MSTYALWQTMIPAHAALAQSTIETWIELASPYVDKDIAGVFYDQAVIYVAAHMYEMSQRPVAGAALGAGAAAAGGQIKSLKAGDVTITFGDTGKHAETNSEAEFAQTLYGQRYLSLCERMVAGKTPGIVF